MLSVRKQDPMFINFVPRNAEEAVDRFMRCKRRGLKAYLVPECLISCARGLSPDEMEKFETWIVNPQDDLSNVKLVETKELRAANDLIFAETLRRVQDKMDLDEIPPLPAARNQDDEKMPGPIPDEDDVMELELMELRGPVLGTATPSNR